MYKCINRAKKAIQRIIFLTCLAMRRPNVHQQLTTFKMTIEPYISPFAKTPKRQTIYFTKSAKKMCLGDRKST